MTGHVVTDWATLFVSLFNTIVMLWLGLTVLLSAERRDWGVWFAGGGLLAGAAFFFSHSAILGYGITMLRYGVNFWWRAGWALVIVAPLAWYVMTLWYSGFWTARSQQLRKRHKKWLIVMAVIAAAMIMALPFSSLFPTYVQAVLLDSSSLMSLGGIPLILLLYSGFIIALILLAIDALINPDPSERIMGDIARQRTRPWLIGTSIVLLIVSIIVTGFMIWAASSGRAQPRALLRTDTVWGIALLDLVIAGLVSVAVLLLGQAIVSYEVFTGKALPRRGFFRQWRNMLVVSAGYAAVISLSIVMDVSPVVSNLITTVLVVGFMSLLIWQSFVDREQLIASLRPFVVSQGLVSGLLDTRDSMAGRAQEVFNALCRDVLNAQQAVIVPMGVLAPLIDEMLRYPDFIELHLPHLEFTTPETEFIALEPGRFSGMQWAIPLWGERGLLGGLLLGDKLDKGLYTQEEFAIARASAERLCDMLAGQEMARRLFSLQHQRLMGSQIVDRRVRRALHDEVLPDLHAAILELSTLQCEGVGVDTTIDVMTGLHHRISDLIHAMPGAASTLPRGDNLLAALQELVRTEMSNEFDVLEWSVEGPPPVLDPLVSEVVYYAAREALRNAAHHARGSDASRLLMVTVSWQADTVAVLEVSDDGVGFRSQGRAETGNGSHGGAGGGLALHSTMMAVIGGDLSVEPAPEGGTHVRIRVPFEALNTEPGEDSPGSG